MFRSIRLAVPFVMLSVMVGCSESNKSEEEATTSPEATSSAQSADVSKRIFVTNEKAGTVSVINADTNTVETTVEVGTQPRGIGIAPDGSAVYIALGEEDKIVTMDPVSLEVVKDLDSGDEPETFAVHPNGNLYISNEEDNMATVLNPATGEKLAQIKVGIEPEGVAVSPDGKRVIVTSESTNMLHVISVPEHEVVANILVGSRPRAATFSADSQTAYASTEIGGEIKKVDMNTNEITAIKQLGDDKAKPKDLLLSKDEKTLYVAGGRANTVFAMDANTLDIIKEIPVGKRVWGLAMNKAGTRLYSSNGVDGTVSVIDTGTNEVVATVEVGKFPWGIAVMN